jgi:hypothetical protein
VDALITHVQGGGRIDTLEEKIPLLTPLFRLMRTVDTLGGRPAMLQ